MGSTRMTERTPVPRDGRKAELLSREIRHFRLADFDARPLLAQYDAMAFQARNLARAARITRNMCAAQDGRVFLGLAGSILSAGMKHIIIDLVRANLLDGIVSTGANIFDMDLHEALGFRHYRGDSQADDHELQLLHIDRIYDTYIDEDELQQCDDAIMRIADLLDPRPHSSREFLREVGAWLDSQGVEADDSLIHACWEQEVPIFVPAFSDCSAGFGLMYHQRTHPKAHVTIDSVRDFSELCSLMVGDFPTGILLLGGGVPKNFLQDAVLGGEAKHGVRIEEASVHDFAVQITTATEYDGALSGSTFREALSWGKVEIEQEQMVHLEASVGFPLLASSVWWEFKDQPRVARRLSGLL